MKIHLPSRCLTRSLRALFSSLLALGALAGLSGTARGDSFLTAIGGDGGGQFVAPCPPGQNLTGFELRVGNDVDAIRPVCVVAYGPRDVSAPVLTSGSGLVPVEGSLA
ncbi:MAG: hypothetical protein ACREA0_13650, partial [bacterium]